MFKKCLKYDLKAFYKIWLIASAVVLVLSILCGFGISGFFSAIFTMESTTEAAQADPSLLTILVAIAQMIIAFLCYFLFLSTLIIFTSGTSILLYIRYYTHFFTDQGYLTFTLPVKRSTQFWSKATCGLIYSLGSGAVSAIAICIVIACISITSMLAPDGASFFPFEELQDLLRPENLGYSLICLVLGVVLLAAVSFASLMMQYLIITLAATLFRKLKVLSVIVGYYVINNIIAVPISYIGSYYVMFALLFLIMGLASVFTVPALGWLCIYALMLLGSVAMVTIGLIFGFFTIQRLERKLNLA